MSSPKTKEEARRRIINFLAADALQIAGLKPGPRRDLCRAEMASNLSDLFSFGSFYLEWEREFGIDTTLHVTERTRFADPKSYTIIYEVEVSWSTTGSQSVAHAVATLTLHREVTEMAALLQSRVEAWEIKETIGGEPC